MTVLVDLPRAGTTRRAPPLLVLTTRVRDRRAEADYRAMTHETDRRDARLLAAGKLDELFAIYRPILMARARLRRLSEAEADDVVQNAMFRVFSELRRGRDYACPIRVVFHMVLQWCVGDFLGISVRHRVVPLSECDVIAPDVDVDRLVERDLLVRALAGLPPRERHVCYLYFMADMAPKEIARTLGMTRNAVDQAIFRARRRLRELLR